MTRCRSTAGGIIGFERKTRRGEKKEETTARTIPRNGRLMIRSAVCPATVLCVPLSVENQAER